MKGPRHYGIEYLTGDGPRYRFYVVEVERGTNPKTSTKDRKSVERMKAMDDVYIGQGKYKEHLGLRAPLTLRLTKRSHLKSNLTRKGQSSAVPMSEKSSVLPNRGFYRELFAAVKLEINEAEIQIVKTVRQNLPLIACSMYSNNSINSSLTLRGQDGFDYSGYSNFSLPTNSVAGAAIASGKIELITPLKDHSGFLDKNLIVEYGLHTAIVIPISLELKSGRQVLSSICMYPKNENDAEALLDLAHELQPVISQVLESSLMVTYHSMREELVQRALQTSDQNSVMHKAIHLLRPGRFEAASVFLHDRRADCLRLSATTGIVGSIHKSHAFYRMNENERLTVRAFKVCKSQLIRYASTSSETDTVTKYRDKTDSTAFESLAVPIVQPKFFVKGIEQKPDCIGVLRVTNRFISFEGVRKITGFSWEDEEVLDYFNGLCSVVLHLFKKVDDKINEFERVVHSLENNVLTVLGALHNMEEVFNSLTDLPEYMHHSLPNSLAFMNSIHEQVKVFKIRNESDVLLPNIENVNLYGDVISKLPTYLKHAARCYSVDDWEYDQSEFTGNLDGRVLNRPIRQTWETPYANIPVVLADAELLLTVFKNLSENSIKYSKKNEPCKMRIAWAVNDDNVLVSIYDAGIGIPEDDVEYIFNETYQAENAMRRRTSGAGIGLYQCRFIMEELGGAVEYVKPRDETYCTGFVVTIPRAD